MRVKFVRTLLVLALLGNIIVWHKIWWLFTSQNTLKSSTGTTVSVDNPQKLHRRLARLITIVIHQFETFENDVAATVDSVLNSFPAMPILIVCNELPYPPLELNFANDSLNNVKLINLQPDFNRSFEDRNPLYFIQTKFVLFLPDATRISSKQVLQEAVLHATETGAIALPIGKNSLNCLELHVKIKEWNLRVTKTTGTTCDAITGKHATLIDTHALKKLSDPFMLPFMDALYLQTTVANIKINIMKNHQLNEGKPLFRSQQSQWKLQQLHQKRERSMFEKLGFKRVIRASGAVDWYGCSRDTPRCFGSIVNGVPSYLYQNRFTPPCCLAGLRKVAHHVFDKLEEVGIRFWLEGSSLLGAMKNGDILPWDYQVEIGINRDDLNRSPWLVKARNKPVTDNHGFVWEKATEGEFYKVQYSKINRLHVNLLPFYVKNGTMTRDSWFLKNRDFPEQFLHPMSSIEFAGRQVPSPNNIRDFLEIKYYKGVVENPELPGKLFN
ncbi:GSCOCG00006385001-RA-CDS [Cotesia congregata]|uniref:Similar to Fkrp: Fukutin-related protein (Mus musculus) n=1 Tax=Cotesia congregata TaxID=51543 RepID=A0A8J2HEX2_COTCN|nr:GSCOCG00006385001-RA-CDS [Cotesia congregata]CAG5096249.1 Similar to Fkrp: Fukutin-related protein (Mus musculus) [Cotesia congregata]